MKKVLLSIVLYVAASLAATGYTVPNNFAARDTIKASKIMANYNAGVNWSTAIVDTMEKRFVRFADTKDTLFDTLKAYRVRASNNLVSGGTATVGGTLSADSVFSTKGVAGTTGSYSSTVSADSISSTKGVKGTYGNFSGPVSGTTGTFSSTVSVDSLKSTKGISGTIGDFSSNVLADSVRSTKGISGTIGRFTSVVSSGGISGTTGTFTSTATVDSVSVTKGAYIGSKVGIGITPVYDLHMDKTNASGLISVFRNRQADSYTTLAFGTDQGNTNGIAAYGSGFATSSPDRAGGLTMTAGYAGGLAFSAQHSSGVITFHTGSSFLERMRITADGAEQKAELSATPSAPAAGAACNIYMKSDKLVIQYLDGATTRYKYLDLTGTGVTWVHTTTAP